MFYGEKNAMWKGGEPIHVVGKKTYKLTIVGKDHHLCIVNTYGYLHRVNAEIKLGRKLLPNEIVSFKDKDTMNCNLDNLLIFNSKHELYAFHRKVDRGQDHLRNPNEKNTIIKCACGCFTEFMKYDKSGRPRKFVAGHNSLVSNNFKINKTLTL
jgi:hypothetical protein